MSSLCDGVVRFLQDLPSPILPSSLQADMIRVVQGEIKAAPPDLRSVHIFSHRLFTLLFCAEVHDLEDCAQVLRGVVSSPSCPAQYGLTLLSVVRHLARVCLHGSRNQLSPRNLAENFSPLLFRHAAGSVTLATSAFK